MFASRVLSAATWKPRLGMCVLFETVYPLTYGCRRELGVVLGDFLLYFLPWVVLGADGRKVLPWSKPVDGSGVLVKWLK